jgi:predicted RNA-binding Zn ribbon-like protein
MSQVRPKSPFEFVGGNPCLNFADTVNNRMRGVPEDELIADYGRLIQWGKEGRMISAKTAERLRQLASEAPDDALKALRSSKQLRGTIYEIFSAVANRRAIPSGSLSILNDRVRQAAQHTQLVRTKKGVTWEWIEPESRMDSVLWPVSRAAAELLVSDDIGYVRQCAAEDCSWLFLDKTKNHKRRWCDMRTCGSREKSRRYYQRRNEGGAG